MSFREELDLKVTDLKEAAQELEVAYLGWHEYFFDEGGELYHGRGGDMYDQNLGRDDMMVSHHDDFLSCLDDVAQRFEFFYDLDVGPLDDMVQQLGGRETGFDEFAENATTYSILRQVDPLMNEVRELTTEEQWSSDGGAMSFRDNFVTPHLHAADLHKAYVQELGLAALSLRQAVSHTGWDIKAIADAGIAAMRTALEGPGFSLGELFTVVSIIRSAVMFAGGPTTVGGLFLAGGWASAFLAGGESESDEPTPQWEIRVPESLEHASSTIPADPIAILSEISDAITQLRQLMYEGDIEIYNALAADLISRDAFANPGLVPGESPEEWPDASDAFTDSTIEASPGALVVSLANLYRVGVGTLPSISRFYGAANRQLRECTMPAWLARYLPYSVPNFHSARDHLVNVLRDIEDYVDETGPKLMQVAEEYELTDQYNAEKFHEIEQIDYEYNWPEQAFG